MSRLVHTPDDYWVIKSPGGYWSEIGGVALHQFDATTFVKVSDAQAYLTRWRRLGTRAWISRVVKRPSKGHPVAQRSCRSIEKLRGILRDIGEELSLLRRTGHGSKPIAAKLERDISFLTSVLREVSREVSTDCQCENEGKNR